MNISAGTIGLAYGLPRPSAKGISDPTVPTIEDGGAKIEAASAGQISTIAIARSLTSLSQINSHLNGLEDAGGAGAPAASSGAQDVNSMTNAQLEAFAQQNKISDVASSFQVDYASADRSATGIADFYESLMSDATKHDFVQQYEEAAKWQAEHGASDGGAQFLNMAAELERAAKSDDKTASAMGTDTTVRSGNRPS